jgi:pyruvate/2-oxoglutarate/acetoin dehydrogenase E1 component
VSLPIAKSPRSWKLPPNLLDYKQTQVSFSWEATRRELARPLDMHKAVVRHPGTAVTLITWGGSLGNALQAAEVLASDGYQAEVIDLRCLRPLDIPTALMESAFYELDAPVQRVCSGQVPIPYARHLEHTALPSVEIIVKSVLELVR